MKKIIVKILVGQRAIIFNGKYYSFKDFEDKKDKINLEIFALHDIYNVFVNPLNN